MAKKVHKNKKVVAKLSTKRKVFYFDAVCSVCSSVFTASHKDRKFCSQKCADSRRYVPTPRVRAGKYVPCAYCGKEKWRNPNKIRDYKRSFCNKDHMILFLKKNAFRKNCVICGKEFYCQPCQVFYRKRKTCSVKCRGAYVEAIAEKSRIENPPTIGALNRRIRYSAKMARWRKAVFERDDYRCQICGVRGSYLQADHIKPFALYPELRFEITNGRTLCRPCHLKTDTFGRKPMYAKNKKESQHAIFAQEEGLASVV